MLLGKRGFSTFGPSFLCLHLRRTAKGLELVPLLNYDNESKFLRVIVINFEEISNFGPPGKKEALEELNMQSIILAKTDF